MATAPALGSAAPAPATALSSAAAGAAAFAAGRWAWPATWPTARPALLGGPSAAVCASVIALPAAVSGEEQGCPAGACERQAQSGCYEGVGEHLSVRPGSKKVPNQRF